jgi:hypothetical protein
MATTRRQTKEAEHGVERIIFIVASGYIRIAITFRADSKAAEDSRTPRRFAFSGA